MLVMIFIRAETSNNDKCRIIDLYHRVGDVVIGISLHSRRPLNFQPALHSREGEDAMNGLSLLHVCFGVHALNSETPVPN